MRFEGFCKLFAIFMAPAYWKLFSPIHKLAIKNSFNVIFNNYDYLLFTVFRKRDPNLVASPIMILLILAGPCAVVHTYNTINDKIKVREKLQDFTEFHLNAYRENLQFLLHTRVY